MQIKNYFLPLFLLALLANSPRAKSEEQVLFGFDDTALLLQQCMRMQLIPYRSPLGDMKSPSLVLPPGEPGTPDSAGACYYPDGLPGG